MTSVSLNFYPKPRQERKKSGGLRALGLLMAECEVLSICPFFNEMIPDIPAVTEGLKMIYCLGDNSECARHMIIKELGAEGVPRTMFPNEQDKARFTLEKKRKSM
jgi:hypothetical protein